MRVRSPSQLRVPESELEPISLRAAELLAPLARSLHNGKCPTCGALVWGHPDTGPDGSTTVEISCFGDPSHVYLFDSTTGHVPDKPIRAGQVGPSA